MTHRMSADRPRRRAVVPGAPIAGMSCFAIEAPAWNDTMATTRLATAAAGDVEDVTRSIAIGDLVRIGRLRPESGTMTTA